MKTIRTKRAATFGLAASLFGLLSISVLADKARVEDNARNTPITLNVKSMPAAQALQTISTVSGIAINANALPKDAPAVTINVKDVPTLDVIEMVAAMVGMEMKIAADGISLTIGTLNGFETAATNWLRAVTTGKIDAAMEAMEIPLLIGERDLREREGKPVRAGVWGVENINRGSLPDFLQKIAPKLAEKKFRVEAVISVSEADAASISPDLAEILPAGGARALIASALGSDALEIFLSPAEKIVAIFDAERTEAGAAGYTGDGKFTDNGARAASMRYVLDLGAVDLLADSASSYKLSGLPSAEFVAGICLEMPHPFDLTRDIETTKPEWFETVKVSLSLIETGTGRGVFKVERSLADLTWTNGSPKPKTSFLYGRAGDASTSFDADGKAAYELRVGIDSSGGGGVPATLLLYGGGRKVANP